MFYQLLPEMTSTKLISFDKLTHKISFSFFPLIFIPDVSGLYNIRLDVFGKCEALFYLELSKPLLLYTYFH